MYLHECFVICADFLNVYVALGIDVGFYCRIGFGASNK